LGRHGTSELEIETKGIKILRHTASRPRGWACRSSHPLKRTRQELVYFSRSEVWVRRWVQLDLKDNRPNGRNACMSCLRPPTLLFPLGSVVQEALMSSPLSLLSPCSPFLFCTVPTLHHPAHFNHTQPHPPCSVLLPVLP